MRPATSGVSPATAARNSTDSPAASPVFVTLNEKTTSTTPSPATANDAPSYSMA